MLNLDGIHEDELPTTADALAKLLSYVQERMIATRCRSNGMIGRAMKHESKMERIYSSLPDGWRW